MASLHSARMKQVGQKNTPPEIAVRKALHGLGLRFRLHRRDLPGVPDIVLPRLRTVVLVHGCFWHQHPGCARARRPKTRTDFWNEKLDRNIERDQRTINELERLGWNVVVVWECQALADTQQLAEQLKAALGL